MKEVAIYWAYVLWTFAILATWNGLPGPWWCKAILIVICFAIPGGLDEIAIVGITAAYRAWKRSRS